MNKKFLLAGIFSTALLIGVDNVYAHNSHHEINFDNRSAHHEKMEQMHQKLAERLKLTDEQKTKAEDIRKSGHEKIKPLMKEMKEIRQKMDKVRHENMKEFENILTDEQKSELSKIKAEKKAEFKNRRHRRDNK